MVIMISTSQELLLNSIPLSSPVSYYGLYLRPLTEHGSEDPILALVFINYKKVHLKHLLLSLVLIRNLSFSPGRSSEVTSLREEIVALAEASEASEFPFPWSVKDVWMDHLPNGFLQRMIKSLEFIFQEEK
ncbi:conserved hypothetical protein [Ricinus communis]|uniref:Uncharacterized protein n=1 Tax=Ricinus communis TaxID=3988 RepID=B9RY57_RICCO|nr:conserved hypothetical protein [Ricinus communis]